MFKIMVLSVLGVISVIGVNISYADDMKSFIHSKESEVFYGASNNVSSEEQVKPLDVSLVKKGECLKFRKNGERYWNKYETEILKVQEVGDKSLKVQRLIFVNSKGNQWMDTDSFAMDFEHQLQYDIFECPKEDDKLSEEAIIELKEKLNRR